jgi:hypothetical protein
MVRIRQATIFLVEVASLIAYFVRRKKSFDGIYRIYMISPLKAEISLLSDATSFEFRVPRFEI